jgi:ATPase subunit of ABC transporter with duplicated ATPase domains
MVKTISLKHITQSFLERIILDGATFKCTGGERVCIVGENGAGKSTLLKIIAGQLEPTVGTVERNGHIRTVYVPQEFNQADTTITVDEYIMRHAGKALYAKVYAIGKTLGFSLDTVKTQSCGLLSGGQQKILALAVGLASVPDFLLLDEPENHLDIVSRRALMKTLHSYKGGILFVSHDRMMIDAVADKVAEVLQGKVYFSEGGYQDYLDAKLSRIEGLQRQYDTESKRMRQLRDNIGILEAKAFRGKDVAKYHKTKEELETLREKHREVARPEDKKTKIRLKQESGGYYDGRLLCRITDMSFGYPQRKGDVFRHVSLDIRSGAHIVLLGRNGSGKSTFLKCLTGTLPPSQGAVVWQDDVSHAYFDQHAEFDPAHTPLQVVTEGLHCDMKRGRGVLGQMKFNLKKMETPIGSLSGGERMRVRFALVFGSNPDFIILDEPTNHLDEVTWEILLDACNHSRSTILLVTHDHEFIDGLSEKEFWVIAKQHIIARHADLEEIIQELA